ncbi:twitching motility protein PilJ [Herbaspirillum rubrisubalbicans]|uniref:methyl-accepting chemotaxis protein n=1 Tax=Herbaspirillum rubrisubalbicans TaxID=80842 RepID=UPI0020A1AA74|nr:methyl-accepting chemotaxis protein [Herbaspirillum rubrisubalbicans]MCP1574345.1 twitching motility protein PilJ [Herbaspirillum rubrisubalbicans]
MDPSLPYQSKKNAPPRSAAHSAVAGAAGKASASVTAPSRSLRLPYLCRFSLRTQTRLLLGVLAVSLTALCLFMWLGARLYLLATLQTNLASDLVMHSQRIGKAVPNAIQGNPQAFVQLAQSRNEFNRGLLLLSSGGLYQGQNIGPPDAAIKPVLENVEHIWRRTDLAGETILGMEKELTGFGTTLKRLNQLLPVMLDLSEQIAMLQSQGHPTTREMAAASQLVMLTLRLGRSSNEFLTSEGVNPETAFMLGKDITAFGDLLKSLQEGNDMLRLRPASDPDLRDKLQELSRVFGEYQPQIAGILGNLQNFIAAKRAEQLVFVENETLKRHLTELQDAYRVALKARSWTFWAVLAAMAMALLSAIGIALAQLQSSRNNAAAAEARRQEAELQRQLAQQEEEKAMRANHQTQTAILRLMTELQKVADGDLTVHTTVSDDVTGAIADSVNYTVEALRGLVEQVTQMAAKVALSSQQVRGTTTELGAAARAQAYRIQRIAQAMLEMSTQINGISVSADESADVARHAVVVAERGTRAVEDAVKAMDGIGEQIRETSGRITRLGASSQMIGEITELISDITERTNVLALNAAIQAASAGEAGRGFSVVAEEVQHLAERSSAATREIGALVRMIQADTRDVVVAMEKSTTGVTDGAVLSDAAGSALADIRSVSKQLAELIQGMAAATREQAVSASGVAQQIQGILSENDIIEQSREQVSTLYEELWDAARQLESSVSRFRVTVS